MALRYPEVDKVAALDSGKESHNSVDGRTGCGCGTRRHLSWSPGRGRTVHYNPGPDGRRVAENCWLRTEAPGLRRLGQPSPEGPESWRLCGNSSIWPDATGRLRSFARSYLEQPRELQENQRRRRQRVRSLDISGTNTCGASCRGPAQETTRS